MAENKIIGRKKELQLLKEVRHSTEAEFVAVYGRRRVGKTFLIREFFSSKGLYLEVAGVKNLLLHEQLDNFTQALSKTFLNDLPLKSFSSWKEAFAFLTKLIEEVPRKEKICIFLDELPWLASRKSGLLQALDYYWNVLWSRLPQLILIVCGSAASWMLEHVVNAKGGLYNRLTRRILLEPFSLRETKEFLQARKVHMRPKQLLDLYMVMGGIPYYLKEIKRGRSAAQNINALCFEKGGILFSEFPLIFHSLFDHAQLNLQIVRAIAQAGNALSREQLTKISGVTSGGTLNKRLEELEASKFIRSYIPIGKKIRGHFYRIVDEYTLFYLRWIDPLVRTGHYSDKQKRWERLIHKPEQMTWAGHAFESVCFKHIDQIIEALQLTNVVTQCGSWSYCPPKRSKEAGAQIDLLIERDDDAITLCEIKYNEKLFAIDKAYAKNLDQKIEVVLQNYPTRKSPTKKEVFLAMITVSGLKRTLYSEEFVHDEVILEDLLL